MMLLTALTPSPRYNRPMPAISGFGFCGSGPSVEEPGLAFSVNDSGQRIRGTGWREECKHGMGSWVV